VVGANSYAATYYNYQIPWIINTGGGLSGAVWTTLTNTSVSYYLTYGVRTVSNNNMLQAPLLDELGAAVAFGGKKIVYQQSMILNSSGTNHVDWGLSATYTTGGFDYNDAGYKMALFTVSTAGNLYAHTSNGGGGADHTETQITGITLTNKNTYRIEYNPGVNALFYVNGVLKATITTTLPTSGAVFVRTGATNTTNYVGTMSAVLMAIEK
jgi:hypothetical protein